MITAREELRQQAHWCGAFGSPFTSQLLERAADDHAAGGIVARLTENWPGNPRADALSLRIAGALHAAALTRRDPVLAAVYPAAAPDWTMDTVWPHAEAFLRREEDHVRDFMRSPPQTNETGRATGLAAGFQWLAALSPQPFHMRELGASAGLNLNWDKFRYAHPPWGRSAGEGPLAPTVVQGAPPAWLPLAIASRAACDQNPLDPSSEADRLRLRAYIWADQTERMARLNAALDLAAASPHRVEKADAAQWVAQQLQAGLQPGTTVVYHSVFFQYPPQEIRSAIAEAIETAGAKATGERRLAWVRFEPEAILGGPRDSLRYVLNIVRWDGSVRTESTLAEVDPHGRTMTWL
ncbi:MAG: DUF2332 family protein [Alphaproteobacteria bacterium]|nr:DUF2332 family protein [Alphaproteobacteria bacterium]